MFCKILKTAKEMSFCTNNMKSASAVKTYILLERIIRHPSN